MKKRLTLIGISFFLLIGCFGCKQKDDFSEIPVKNDPNGVSIALRSGQVRGGRS